MNHSTDDCPLCELVHTMKLRGVCATHSTYEDYINATR